MRKLDHWLYLILMGWMRLIGRLPKDARRRIAQQMGRLLFATDAKHRRITLDNLHRAFGNEKSKEQIDAIARAVFENLFHIVFELGWSLRLDETQLSAHFTVSGLETYQRAMDKGKGVLFLVAHFGNWELMPIAAHLGNMPVRIVYRPLDTPWVDHFFKMSRSRFGHQPVPTHRGTMRQIYVNLKRGYPVGMLMDQNVDWYEGVFVDFFGRRACTNTGMALLALRSEAPVLPAFMVRTPSGFHAVFGPELPLIRTGDRIKDVELNTQQYNRVIECYVRRFPDQWFWVHQRWKTRPYQPWPREKNQRVSRRSKMMNRAS